MPFLHTFYRKYLLLCGLGLCCLLSNAQKEDYIWLSGYRGGNGFVGYDSTQHALYGHSIMNFNYSPIQITYDSLRMSFSATNVSYCDGTGNLLFYSNGVYVSNALDQKIENSDSLNVGYFTAEINPGVWYYGYEVADGMMALPSPDNNNQYYLFHTFADSAAVSHQPYTKSFYVTLLDMNANAGLGKVLYKNVPVVTNNLSYDVSATKHANGRDWWVIAQKRNTNCYYKILLTPQGASLYDSSCLGITLDYPNNANSVFSNDGSKFAQISFNDGLSLFDFDRCTGGLSNSRFIPISILRDSFWINLGVEFSPNNRFLYVCLTKFVLQYDLWDTNWENTPDTVAKYDGYKSPFGSFFHTAQIGPDGKIYISCGNGENVYHVIERPDEKGDSCLFRQHGIQLPTFSVGVPNFPNYRLGALAGSGCDTLTALTPTLSQRERELRVFPNPASDAVTVDYGYTNWEKGDVDLEITNASGQLVYTQHLPMYSGFQRLDVTQYATGIYTVAIKRGNSIVATSQFVKQ